LFLANAKSEYADTYSAIMALRFHGTEGGVIDREKIVKSVRHMLNRPQLADLVIPDLARWEDWESMDDLVKLFKTADEKSSWVRVPVINFLRACPLPEAKEHLAELEKIDPAAVKRANMFFPGGGGTPAPTDNKASDAGSPAQSGLIAAVPETTAATKEPMKISRVKTSEPPELNLWVVGCVPWVIGLVLMSCQWAILSGAGR
jgi:hypothetical protein